MRTVQDTFASLRRLPSFSLPSLYGQSRHPYNLGLNLRNLQIKYLYTFLALTKLQLLEMGGNDCVKSEFKDPNICLRLSTLHFLTRTHYDTWQGQYLCSVHSHQSCFGVLANPYLRLCCKEDGKRQEEDLSICCLGAFCFVWG